MTKANPAKRASTVGAAPARKPRSTRRTKADVADGEVVLRVPEPWGILAREVDEDTGDASQQDSPDDEPAPVEAGPTPEELAEREQLKRVLLPLLKDSLRIRVEPGHFVSPNDRTIRVFFDEELVTECTFDIRARREYEG